MTKKIIMRVELKEDTLTLSVVGNATSLFTLLSFTFFVFFCVRIFGRVWVLGSKKKKREKIDIPFGEISNIIYPTSGGL